MTSLLVRVFASAVVRKLAYAAVGALLLLAFGGHKAHADPLPAGSVVRFCADPANVNWSDDQCAHLFYDRTADAQAGYTYAGVGTGCPGADNPTPGGSCTGMFNIHGGTPPTTVENAQPFTISYASCGPGYTITTCPDRPNPNNCSATSGSINILTALSLNQGGAYGHYCVAGCNYDNSLSGAIVTGGDSQTAKAVPTGESCSGTDSGHAPATQGNCFSIHGTTICSSDDGQYGTVDGNVVDPRTAAPAGSCKGYSDGAAACVVSMDHPHAPAPTDSSGNPEDPTATVQPVAGGGGTVNYYSSGSVAGSHTPVNTQNGNTAAGSGTVGQSGNAQGSANGTGSGSGHGSGNGSGDGTGGCVPSAQDACGDSASGGGDCDAPPSCSGDPVQCATLNQSWLMRCKAGGTDAQVASAIGDTGTIPQDGGGGDFSSAVNGSNGPFASGDGSCPGPTTISVMGRSFSLDIWSKLCNFASYISGIVLAIGYLLAARIVFGGVAGGFEQGA